MQSLHAHINRTRLIAGEVGVFSKEISQLSEIHPLHSLRGQLSSLLVNIFSRDYGNTIQLETFEGENFCEFCSFLAICGSFLCKIWGWGTFGAVKASNPRNFSLLKVSYYMVPCLKISVCSQKYSLLIEPYLAVEYNKCYCETCAARRGDLPVKYQGSPGAQMKYAVPLGWVKCALR